MGSYAHGALGPSPKQPRATRPRYCLLHHHEQPALAVGVVILAGTVVPRETRQPREPALDGSEAARDAREAEDAVKLRDGRRARERRELVAQRGEVLERVAVGVGDRVREARAEGGDPADTRRARR